MIPSDESSATAPLLHPASDHLPSLFTLSFRELTVPVGIEQGDGRLPELILGMLFFLFGKLTISIGVEFLSECLLGGGALVFVENSVSVGVIGTFGLIGCLGSDCLSESGEQEERQKESW